MFINIEDIIKTLKYWEVFIVLDINHCITQGYSLALPCIILGECLKLSCVVCHQCSVLDFLQVFKDNNETWGLFPFEQVSHQNITDVHYHMNLAQFLNPQITVISEFTLCNEWRKIVILFISRLHCDKKSFGNNHIKLTVALDLLVRKRKKNQPFFWGRGKDIIIFSRIKIVIAISDTIYNLFPLKKNKIL